MSMMVNPFVFAAGGGGPPAWSGPPGLFAESGMQSYGGVASCDVNYPGGIAVEDIAILQVQFQDFNGSVGSIATPSGWTEVAQDILGASNEKRQAVFWKRLTGSESGAVTVSPSGAGFCDSSSDTKAVTMSIWRGCIASGTPYEGAGTNKGQNASPVGIGITTTGADRTIVGCYSADDDTGVLSAGSGFTLEYTHSSIVAIDHTMGLTSREVPSAASISAEAASLATSERWGAICFALLPR